MSDRRNTSGDRSDPANPDAYDARARLSQMRGEERSIFKTNAERAIDLSPNDAFILADLGTWMAYSGEWENGKDWVSRAMLLNPKHQSWWHFIWQLHGLLLGDYEASPDPRRRSICQAITELSDGLIEGRRRANLSAPAT